MLDLVNFFFFESLAFEATVDSEFEKAILRIMMARYAEIDLFFNYPPRDRYIHI